MLNVYFCIFFVVISFSIIEAFFLLEDKEPFFLCYKVCPLYCTPRRRYDDDASSLIYTDDDLPPFIYDEEPEVIFPHRYFHSHLCKSPTPTTTTTTTQATTTTTEEPTFICMLCKRKCNKKS